MSSCVDEPGNIALRLELVEPSPSSACEVPAYDEIVSLSIDLYGADDGLCVLSRVCVTGMSVSSIEDVQDLLAEQARVLSQPDGVQAVAVVGHRETSCWTSGVPVLYAGYESGGGFQDSAVVEIVACEATVSNVNALCG